MGDSGVIRRIDYDDDDEDEGELSEWRDLLVVQKVKRTRENHWVAKRDN